MDVLKVGCRNVPSFLSEPVRKLVLEAGQSYSDSWCTTYDYINPSLTLKWDKIELLLNITENFCIHEQHSDWFLDAVDNLWQIFTEAHSMLFTSTLNQDTIKVLWEWTSHPKEVQEYFYLFLHREVSATEAVLFLTAILERSLGNLFLMKEKNVPSLLRDLLASSEIKIILGDVPVVFLQILVGTPLALNLRNLAWHGFPRPDEFYPQFVSILFVIILSIGDLLNQSMISVLSIPKRPQIQILINVFDDAFPIVKKFYSESLEILSSSDYIPQSHYPYWKDALEHHIHRKQGRSLLLLLPQLEHMLRCLFCFVNNCAERTLTAESYSLYTTLNEIMSEHITSEDGVKKENELIGFLGESIIEMLQDLFVHQAGPRIRDKISHGECNIHDVPENIVNQLICVILIIEIKTKANLGSKITQNDNKILELRSNLCVVLESYTSKFHPSSLLKMKITHCSISLNNWSTLFTTEFCEEMQITEICSEETELSSLIKQVSNCLKTLHLKISRDTVSTFIVHMKIHTVFRPKIENELIGILNKIMDNVKEICVQVFESLQEKYSQFTQHLLRSRQRETFQHMVHLIPKLKDVLFFIFCITISCLQSVNSVGSLSNKEFQDLTKFSRLVLQYVQNVVSLTKRDKNRWMEIEVLSTKFLYKVLENLKFSFFKEICSRK